jgi:hypothetical protein
MMKLTKVQSGIINQYEMWGAKPGTSRMIRISEDTEVKKVTLTLWVNHGETIVRSRSYKTVSGAERYARKWLVS